MPSKMRSTPRSKVSSFQLKALSAAVLSAVVLSNAYAAGLGKLTVLSSLGQPLKAEIELTSVAKDEIGSLVPRLASADAFRQANIDLSPVLFSLRFAVDQRNGNPVVRVTSTQPINEPFVDMLLELGGGKGKLVREYTFLLDPPEMRSSRAASQVTPVVIGQTASAAEANRPAAVTSSSESAAPAPMPTPAADATREPQPQSQPRSAKPAAQAPAAPSEAESTDKEYEVRKGDSLAKIANQYRSGGVSLDQMLVALYRANPDAFIGKNMNRLRAGQILSIPETGSADAIDQSEARGVVVAQAADFNSYRNKLAAQIATADAKPSEESKQTAGGKITTRIQEESGSGSNAQDKLKLSKSGTASNTGGASGASEEELIARDKALAEANARVKELEKNVSDLQKILEIKNKDLAAQQKQVETAPATVAAAPAETAAPAASAEKTATENTVPAPAAAEQSAEATAPAPVEEAKPAPAPVKPKRVVPPPAPVHEPSFFEDLTGNPMFLPGAAVVLALLAGLGIYSSRRRKQQPKSFEDSIITDSSLKSNSLFGSTGGQSVDTNNSVFNSNFVPSASQLDTNEVDPIAEADVYVAYGRDAQAEEILKEALRNQPDRHAVRVKLLEIYSSRNDVRSFEILATELYSMTRGEGEEWKQAAALGLILDPANPLYASGALPDDVAARTSSLTASTQPLDEGGLDDLLATTQPHPNTTLETSPYFNNTTMLTEEALNQEPVHKPEAAAVPEQPKEQKPLVEDLDFDLEGFDVDEPAKPQDAPKAELPADVAAIDFDFLDDKSATSTKNEFAAPASAASPEVLAPDAFDLEFPSSDTPHAAETPAIKPPEFDLSDIALELEPGNAAATQQDALPPLEGLDDDSFSSNAEMATKLDLAIAYQEIGDKEGARELLEEVVKGGSSEQVARAGELLDKLS